MYLIFSLYSSRGAPSLLFDFFIFQLQITLFWCDKETDEKETSSCKHDTRTCRNVKAIADKESQTEAVAPKVEERKIILSGY